MKGYKTLIGVLLTLAAGIAAIWDIQPVEQLPEWGEAILMMITASLALYGRAKADGPMAPALTKGREGRP